MPYGVPDLTPLANFSEDDLKEMVMGELSPRVDNMAVDKADLTITYKVPGTKLTGFLCWMLGVDYVDSESKLRRTCPAFHPVHAFAWCDTVQIQGMGFRGDDTDIVQYEFQNTPGKWDSYVAVCSFSMPNYNIAYDEDVTYEYQRFLAKEFEESTELVNINPGQVVYDAPGTGWDARPSLQVVTRRETAGIKLLWKRVPWAYLAPDDDTLPVKLMQMQGRVNDATFLGQPAETLLCKQVRFPVKYVSPLLTDTLGQLYFMVDVEMLFCWYDPEPKGKAGETRHGWNFMLGPDLKYYYATNATSGRPVFESFTFDKAFTIYTDTWTAP